MDIGELKATLTADTSEWSAKLSAASDDIVKLGSIAVLVKFEFLVSICYLYLYYPH